MRITNYINSNLYSFPENPTNIRIFKKNDILDLKNFFPGIQKRYAIIDDVAYIRNPIPTVRLQIRQYNGNQNFDNIGLPFTLYLNNFFLDKIIHFRLLYLRPKTPLR